MCVHYKWEKLINERVFLILIHFYLKCDLDSLNTEVVDVGYILNGLVLAKEQGVNP